MNERINERLSGSKTRSDETETKPRERRKQRALSHLQVTIPEPPDPLQQNVPIQSSPVRAIYPPPSLPSCSPAPPVPEIWMRPSDSPGAAKLSCGNSLHQVRADGVYGRRPSARTTTDWPMEHRGHVLGALRGGAGANRTRRRGGGEAQGGRMSKLLGVGWIGLV